MKSRVAIIEDEFEKETIFAKMKRWLNTHPVTNLKKLRKGYKIGRNEPCPCKSGLKYKKCCGTPPSLGDIE